MTRKRRGPVVLGALAAGAAVAAVVAARRMSHHLTDRSAPGGQLMPNDAAYDVLSRVLMGPLFRSIARDVAATSPPGATVLEVGCGPGHLAILLAREHDLDVTGLDLDPDMITRAEANAKRAATPAAKTPKFVTGDAAALPFEDAAFDLVLSTFSLHHWTDAKSGLNEMARVLRPGGRVLIWDFKGGHLPIHPTVPDPMDEMTGTALRVVSVTPWRWPWRFSPSERLELAHRTD